MSDFSVGDQVTWMKTTIRGSMIGIETKDGTIESIDGSVATVKPPKKGSRRVRVHVSRLRKQGERTELMETLDQVLPSKKGADHATPTD